MRIISAIMNFLMVAIDCPKNCPINVHVRLVEFSYYKQKFNSRNILSPENISLVGGCWSVVGGRWSVPWSVVGGFVITRYNVQQLQRVLQLKL